ncbi:MAG: RNA 3'-terminal phosphate cyclase, partial [Planctomycetes bacterium]|nr:RNA 3'-terminal phosphate cyclase [Planctomycetota bacterium]
PHLADQLLLPMALAGGGSFRTTRPTTHTTTNARVIEVFLPLRIEMVDEGAGTWRIAVRGP